MYKLVWHGTFDRNSIKLTIGSVKMNSFSNSRSIYRFSLIFAQFDTLPSRLIILKYVSNAIDMSSEYSVQDRF